MSRDDSFIIEETKSKEELEKIIEDLQEKVENLYLFRDHYFENHSIEKAVDKDDDIKNRQGDILNLFKENEENTMSGVVKAQYLYLKGKTLNVMTQYDPSAAQALSKAVKLDPSLVDAWNELGECYWKDNNLSEAKNCFSGALPRRKNKISLRNMSIILRQEVISTPKERQKNIEKSVELAKEAVQLDPKDGVSWSILGNAYLCSFFVIAQDPSVLKLCMSAYKQAVNDPVARGQANLHYNRAVAFKYEEEYLNALESFTQAISLDPTWTDPPTEKCKLIEYLDSVNDFVKSKGKMKGKKLQQMIQQIDSKLLGPYSEGKFTNGSETIKLDCISIDDLKEGVNSEKVILGKVVCSVRNENLVPFTFCIVDAKSMCVAVTVYNLADGKGVIIGDSVAIPEPYVTRHKFNFEEKIYDYFSIRVDNPMVMVVNNKKIGKNQIAGTRITSSFKVI